MGKSFLFLYLLVLLAAGEARADSIIQFYEPYFGGIADNFSNAAGLSGTNGMRWGILVDTTGNGFAGAGATKYDGYVSTAQTDGFWGVGGTTTDDYYIAGALTVDASTAFPGGDDGGTTPGNGSMIDDLVVPYPAGVTAGDAFALVWFDSNSTAAGAKYGFFTHPSFVLPANDGNSTSYGTPFLGVDPIRAASNTFAIVTPPSNYATWAASRLPPVTGGTTGDDDKDGVQNLVEYALGDGVERGTLSGSVITYSKRGLPFGNDLTYILETSEALTGLWTPVLTHGPAQIGTPLTYDLAPGPGILRKFARLRVVKSP